MLVRKREIKRGREIQLHRLCYVHKRFMSARKKKKETGKGERGKGGRRRNVTKEGLMSITEGKPVNQVKRRRRGGEERRTRGIERKEKKGNNEQ